MPDNKRPADDKLPADGSIAFTDGVFYQVRRPVFLVEARTHDGSQPKRYKIMTKAATAAAMRDGDLVVVEIPPSADQDQSANDTLRPYPFERARHERLTTRSSVWEDAGVAALRRRGLVFTGREFERRLARVRRMSRQRAADAAND